MARPSNPDDRLSCSFCGEPRHKVKRLIAGPGVYICDQCVALCQEMLTEPSPGEPSSSTPTGPSASPAHEDVAAGLPEDELPAALERLPYRERRILELRLGRGGERRHTLDELARTFGVSRGSIRRIERQALGKLPPPAQPQS